SIALIPNEIIRSEYIKACSHQLQTREELLLKEVSKKRYELAERNRQKRNYEKHQQELGAQQPPSYTNPEAEAPVSEDLLRAMTQAPDQEQKPVSQPKKQGRDPLEAYEKNLLKMVVRYGERVLYQDEETCISVLQFIKSELEDDQIVFRHPVYRDMMQEAYEQLEDEEFIPERYFLRHHRNDFSMIAAELITERYELSKIYRSDIQDENGTASSTNFTQKVEKEEDLLFEIVPRYIMELKYRILREKITEAMEQIKLSERQGNNDALLQWMKEYRNLRELEKAFAKELGERIISR
ncbi:MAG: hypothetical protein J6V16_05425, partial [Bacteroidales bacterium]|nr:hypothetical protein [Bacteroidales bacterium]